MSKKTTESPLDREDVKRYLQQYHAAQNKKKILEDRHRTLSRELQDPGVGSPFRTMPTSKPTKTEGAVSVVYRIAEVEDRIEKQRGEMTNAVLHVMDLIDLLPQDSTERTVVELRHIDCISKPFRWCKVKFQLTETGAVKMHGCRDGMKRARRKMKMFQPKVAAGEKTTKEVAEWLQSQIAYYQNYNDHGRVLRLRRLFYAIYGGANHV